MVRREVDPQPKDALIRAYSSLCAKLAAVGLAAPPARRSGRLTRLRVAASRPDLAARGHRALPALLASALRRRSRAHHRESIRRRGARLPAQEPV